MINTNQPLVTILTPVHNGEKFLRKCIESVIKQTYSNWEYIIINNCSTDRTLEIAKKYSIIDDRIQVHTNNELVDVIENHNIAFSYLSTSSKYCKIVHADDWIFTQCLEQMVDLAEAHSSIGVVSAYSLSENKIYNKCLPHMNNISSGKDIARKTLLDECYPFISPSSILIKSQHIRDNSPYYNTDRLDADIDALFNIFQKYDFGFVHQILTFVSSNEDSMTAKDFKTDHSQLFSRLHLLIKYGPVFLETSELSKHKKLLISKCYRVLTQAIFELRGKKFWKTQIKQLAKLDYKLNYFRLISMCLKYVFMHPILTLRKIRIALCDAS